MEEQDVFALGSCGAAAQCAECCWAKQSCAELSGERRHQRKARNGCCQNSTFNEDIKMLALQGPRVMDRLSHEMAVRRDRQVRLHSVQTDLELDLPPNIALPDGEEVPYGSSTRLQIRDNEQVRPVRHTLCSELQLYRIRQATCFGWCRRVKYTRNVSGHHQTAQCLMVNLHHHTGQVQQVCSVVGILGTGPVGAVVSHRLCDVTACQVVLCHHGARRPHTHLLLLYLQAHAVSQLSQTQVVVVLLQTLPWSHVTLNQVVFRNHLHPSMEPSDLCVATTGRPLPQGLSDYVAQLFQRMKTSSVVMYFVFQLFLLILIRP